MLPPENSVTPAQAGAIVEMGPGPLFAARGRLRREDDGGRRGMESSECVTSARGSGSNGICEKKVE
jgi:hypothetical protein